MALAKPRSSCCCWAGRSWTDGAGPAAGSWRGAGVSVLWARDARRWVDSGGVADVAAQGSGAVASSGAHRMPHWDVADTTRSMGQRGQTISPLPDMDG